MRVILISIIFAIIALLSCRREADRPESTSPVRQIAAEGLKALNNADGTKARMIGLQLLDSSKFTKTSERIHADIFGRIILGQSYILLDSADKIYRPLHEAELLCIENGNDSALTSVYNGLGMYALNYERDYTEALRYYFAGIEAAERSSYKRMHSFILSNIAAVYLLEEDPHGINYSMECYHQGKKMGDIYLQYTGAITAANHYILKGELDMASRFASEAEMLLHADGIKDKSLLYATLGRIHQLKGDTDEASRYYDDAISAEGEHPWIRVYVYYADLLESRGRIAESRKLLSDALRIIESGQELLFRREVLPALSAVEGKLGNTSRQKALLDEYKKETELRRNADGNSPMAHIRMKYDLERADNELARQNAELKEKRILVAALVWGVAAALVIIFLIVAMYRRKVRLHASIVRQAVESARREASLQAAVAELGQLRDNDGDDAVGSEPETPSPDAEKETTDSESEPAAESPADRKYALLQARFEALMQDRENYCYNMVTKEKVARQLGTNRTYLSQMINTVYGMSFTDFINNLRIKEAIRILSDPNDSTPLKDLAQSLGYNSISTFYANFKETTGMTPAAFRQQAMKI